MRLVCILLVIFFYTQTAGGQTQHGRITDSFGTHPLFGVLLVNQATGTSTTTDADGNFTIPAQYANIISATFSGFNTRQFTSNPNIFMNVAMVQLNVKMDEFVLKGYTRFQKDSAEMSELFSKDLNTKTLKPKVTFDGGIGVSGLIGSAVQKMSKSYKDNKRFKSNFKNDMEQKFIDTRYTQVLVNSLTGFTGDTLVSFMNTYPMAYEFARAGTDLEMKMWIRDNFKEWKKGSLK